MRSDWDARAKENARYYVATLKDDWTDEEFFASGEQTVAEEILTDMMNICQGKDPKQMRVIEIGCGAGRITRALATSVRRSPRSGCQRRDGGAGSHRHSRTRRMRLFIRTTAWICPCFPQGPYDFAFSTIVFQHIPSREVIYNYVREVHRLLRPGALFKFQVQGDATTADLAG